MQIFPNCKYFISVYPFCVCGVSDGRYPSWTGLAAWAKGRERGNLQRMLTSGLSTWIRWNLGVFTCSSLWMTAELPQRVEFVDYKKYRVLLHDYKKYVILCHFGWTLLWIFVLLLLLLLGCLLFGTYTIRETQNFCKNKYVHKFICQSITKMLANELYM